ncbi:SsrA-binding protein [Mycoplasmopsis gallinacea]|uniref:SsrA-binding protein n=1 Tax=Mycoplasmopsis gallinacea TaxID=29556 RepID=A0A449A264_9BACT|nr:SsrA-binding protein [Mycoplasmopsis gallinacea]QIW62592.1 SsrA-binding protein [Mycoplasmopsis gallinacea]VEU58345.1 SsrA RNA (tmRNA)-binding protein [Mycoplasmopsis gallinacea]
MKIVSNNKRVSHNYEILERYEAGISLLGWEVKSARASSIDLSNAFCSIYKNEIYLKEAYFKQYMLVKGDEFRDRKLLMNKREIRKLKFISETQPVTIIPTKIYFNNASKVKVEIAIAKGLKKYDKREKIAKEEAQKRLQKTLKLYQ